MPSITNVPNDLSLSSLMIRQEEDLNIMARNDVDEALKRREKMLEELQRVEQELKKARERLTFRGLDSILLLDDDSLQHILSFCEYNEVFEFDQTCRRFQKLASWDKYDNDISDTCKWVDKGMPSTSRSRKIRYERAASFASRLEPLLPAHMVDVDDGESCCMCEGCDDFPAATNYDCFKPGERNKYAFFIRIFEQKNPITRTYKSKPSINNFLWQGFVNANDCQPDHMDEKQSSIGFKTQEGFDRRKYFPAYDSAVQWRNGLNHPVGDRNIPSDVRMSNAGFVIIAMHLIDKSMSLVYAATEIKAVDAKGNIFFGVCCLNEEGHPGFDGTTDIYSEVEAEIRADPSDGGLQFCLTLLWPNLMLQEG